MHWLRLLAALACAAACSAHAATVSLSPSAGGIAVGGAFVVDVVVDGLAPGQSVAGFDIDLVFDPALLAGGSVAFGAALGEDGVDQFSSAVFDAGRVDLAAVSLLSGPELLALQGGPFSIATVTLLGLAPGTTAILFDLVTPPGLLFSDAAGVMLPVAVGGEASVTVGPGGTVAEPASAALAVLALAGLAAAGQRRRRRR